MPLIIKDTPPRAGSALPDSDWTCRAVRDAKEGDASGAARCEFCGTKIRWVHVLEHDEHHGAVDAGCCCAERLCFDYDATGAERGARNAAAQRVRFLDRARWKNSRRNPDNIWRDVNVPGIGRVKVTVFQNERGYCVFVAGKGEDRYCDPARFRTQSAALERAWELVLQLMS